MSLTATTIIDRARDYSPAFNEADHPESVVLRFLSDYQRELISLALRADQYFLATPLIQAFPIMVLTDPLEEESEENPLIDGFDLGVTLPEFFRFHGGTVTVPDDYTPDRKLNVVSWANRLNAQLPYSAYLVNRTVHFCGTVLTWEKASRVELLYTPVPADVDAIESLTFALPDSASKSLIDAAALFMAGRAPSPPSIPVTAGRAEAMWVEEIRRNQTPAFFTKRMGR